jgi:serine/threonine protein kinase
LFCFFKLKQSSRDSVKNVAVKILNPVGFKLMSSGPLQRCLVAKKGQPLHCSDGVMSSENVWWCVHPGTRALIAAMPDESRSNLLKELPLPKCIEIWGWDPLNEGRSSGSDDELSIAGAAGGGRWRQQQQQQHNSSSSGYSGAVNGSDQFLSDEAAEKLARSSGETITVDGLSGVLEIPKVPIKYIRWLRARQNIYKEIAHMAHLGSHPNVVGLLEVLEYIQDSKTTLFLVLEMVTGGELFDRIKIGKGTSEVLLGG